MFNVHGLIVRLEMNKCINLFFVLCLCVVLHSLITVQKNDIQLTNGYQTAHAEAHDCPYSKDEI